jgi:hypothetical protein
MTEKGEGLCGRDRSAWTRESLFGLFKAMADHDAGRPLPPEWGGPQFRREPHSSDWTLLFHSGGLLSEREL